MSKPRGPVPKPDSQRRRRNKPVNYGQAEPTVIGTGAQQPRLGFTAHKLVRDMWKALATSVEGQFYSPADWARCRLELWFMNGLLTGEQPMSAAAWGVVQNGLSEMLISPQAKRRLGIELRRSAIDPDEVAAVDQIAEYRQRIKSIQ